MTEIPIACTLSDSNLERRLDEMAAVGRDALLAASSGDGAASLRFQDGPGVRDRLQAIVDAEAACCAFLEMTVTERDGTLVLSIAANEGGEFVVDELADAFRGVPR